jgi:outer membrane protein assembly factor BamA
MKGLSLMSQRWSLLAWRQSVGVLGLLYLLGVAATTSAASADATVDANEPAQRESPLVFAPMFVSNPAFGDGFGATGLYFYRPQPEDAVSPQSAAGGFGLYSDTDSYFTGLFNQMYLNEDTWRLVMGGVDGRINHDLDMPVLESVRFESKIGVAGGGFERRVWRDFFVGLNGGYRKIRYRARNQAAEDYFQRFDVQDNSSGVLAVPVSYDTRDNIRFPHSGHFIQVKGQFVPDWLGAEHPYQAVEAEINQYRQMRSRRILALRLYTRQTPSNTPFEGLCTLGRNSDLRGYMAGEHVAQNLISGQVELRAMLTQRLGVAGFGGLALLYDGALANVTGDDLFSSVGVGLRFMLHKETRQTYRIDYAWGTDDESGLYVAIGEAF